MNKYVKKIYFLKYWHGTSKYTGGENKAKTGRDALWCGWCDVLSPPVGHFNKVVVFLVSEIAQNDFHVSLYVLFIFTYQEFVLW